MSSKIRSSLRALVFLSGSAGLCLAAAAPSPALPPPLWASKPDAKAFEATENAHLAAAKSSIDTLVSVKGARTIENTLVPYDDAVRELDSAAYFSGLMEEVHPEAAFRDAATAMTRKVSAVQTDLSLNRDVYKALSALDLSRADTKTKYYVTRQLLLYRQSGVDKDDATRARLRKLSDELTETVSAFERNISDDMRTTEADPAELKGLPQDYIDRHKPGADGKVKITSTYPDTLPAMKFAESSAFRRRLWEAFQSRAYPKNKDVVVKMATIRAEIAKLLGYASWADYDAAPKMAVTAERIAKFLGEVEAASREGMNREFETLLAEKRKHDPGAAEVGDYEASYLFEQVRRAGYDFDSQSVRPYLPYPRVRQGILDTASKLFHVTFQPRPDAGGWDPSVETFEVWEGGDRIGRIYLDMHPRAGKFTHANMVPIFDGVAGKQLPEAALVCNFPEATASDPGLMEYGDVVTFFHEFGHLVHWVLSGRQQWAGANPLNLEQDFIEAPSQMLEEWMHSPQVLASFAKHYKTGETIPAELVARMNRASAFGRGNWAATQNAFAATSFEIYRADPATLDPDAIYVAAYRKYTRFTPTPGVHTFAAFGHLGGYSSAVYTYLWDKVIAEDFAGQFDRANLLDDKASLRYRRTVLEPGGTESANDIVKNFLGRAQNMEAFQKWMGEEFEGSPAGQTYSVKNLPLPGGPGPILMDYIAFDPAIRSVWVPAGNTGLVDVIDSSTHAIRQISGFPTAEMGTGERKRKVGPSSVSIGEGVAYVGNRGDSSICAFDSRTLAKKACQRLDAMPDGVAYVGRTKEVWVTTPRDKSIRVLDAGTLAEKGKLTFEGSPEGFAVDGKNNRFYTNLEDKDRTLAIDLESRKIVATWNPSCGQEGPRGLRVDPDAGHLFVACTARVEVLDTRHGGAVLSSIDPGEGVDDLDYRPDTHLLYVGASRAGRLTVARVDAAGKLSVVATVNTPTGSRNPVATDTGAVYLTHAAGGEVVVAEPEK
jgi:thimet oligopeptidase